MTQQELDNLSWLPTVTYEQFLDFDPCWLDDEEKAAHDAGTSTSGKQKLSTAIVAGKERKING